MACDAWGNLFIADFQNNMVRKVDSHGIISRFAGNRGLIDGGDGGAAINASIDAPIGVSSDAWGNLYISS